MQPHAIVEAFDPIDDIESGLGSAVISELISTLDFQRFEEALPRRIIPAVRLATHRLSHPVILDQAPLAY